MYFDRKNLVERYISMELRKDDLIATHGKNSQEVFEIYSVILGFKIWMNHAQLAFANSVIYKKTGTLRTGLEF